MKIGDNLNPHINVLDYRGVVDGAEPLSFQ
jgi:hypothetical protein